MSKLEFTRGEIIASKYEVVDPIDESPLGVTYRVKHQKSGKFVRLTMLRPKIAGREQKDQLLDIYRRVKDLNHPALLKVGELGEHEGVAYFTAEDFDAPTLRQLLTEYKVEGKQFELKEAAQISLQMLDGLDALHKQGIFVRGLRPEYVLVQVRRTGPGNKNIVARVKIVGSGFWDLVPAGILAEDEFARSEAQYLAPEMKSFEPIASPRADIYSAGVMFYEMLTGVAPLGTFQNPASLRTDLPKLINEIVELALAQSPEDRYKSSGDFTAAIQRTISDAEVETTEKRSPWGAIIVLLGIGAVLAASIGVILMYGGRDSDAEQAALAADTKLRNDTQGSLISPPIEELQALLAQNPPNMAYIPAGQFVAGRMNKDEAAPTSEPLTQVIATKAYLIDKFEFPNQLNAQPKFDVDYADAERMCSEQGKRLCTAIEWEKACKGPLASIYGYETSIPDTSFDNEFCGDGIASRGYPSGSMAKCKSGYGVYDQSGGFREWTNTAPNGKESRRIVKGGQSNVTKDNPEQTTRDAERATRCAFGSDEGTGFKDTTMSFRCCRDADAPPWTPPAPVPPPTVP